MMLHKLHLKISQYIKIMQQFANRLWYPPLIGFLAALDNFIVIIPNDGILISSSMLTPRRWFVLAFTVAVGSTIGAIGLAALVDVKGLPWILEIYPGLKESQTWLLILGFFEKYGLVVVFLVAITPFAQQPAVILASLAHTPLLQLGIVIFTGRFIKFLIMAYIGSHAPKFLSKLWGIKGDLKDAGVKLE